MTREKFPEKIPFRLTRMLTNAMEVSVMEMIICLSNQSPRVSGKTGVHQKHNFKPQCLNLLHPIIDNELIENVYKYVYKSSWSKTQYLC